MSNRLSHIDEANQPKMVDVTPKDETIRLAEARGCIRLASETVAQIAANAVKKGNVLLSAELAGVMAAKRTPDIVPLAHPLLLTHVDVRATLMDTTVEVAAIVTCRGRTGVEMEALTAVSAALLTVYDMCKAVDKEMCIEGIRLVRKEKRPEGGDG